MVSADHFDPALVGRAHRAIDPLHSQLYFAPEHDEHLSATGLKPGRMSYFAGRAASTCSGEASVQARGIMCATSVGEKL